MARRKLIYEGKAKILYEGPEPGTIVQYFKDDATANNAEKHAVVEGKGVLNNRLSEFFMQGLNAIGVPTHFIRRLNMREQLVEYAHDRILHSGRFFWTLILQGNKGF
jgi:phosphoribosylaminoimidazole-succinocarboxamide synthase